MNEMLHTMKIQIFYWNFAVSRTKWSPWIVFIIAWQSNDYKLQCEYNRIESKPLNELHTANEWFFSASSDEKVLNELSDFQIASIEWNEVISRVEWKKAKKKENYAKN